MGQRKDIFGANNIYPSFRLFLGKDVMNI